MFRNQVGDYNQIAGASDMVASHTPYINNQTSMHLLGFQVCCRLLPTPLPNAIQEVIPEHCSCLAGPQEQHIEFADCARKEIETSCRKQPRNIAQPKKSLQGQYLTNAKESRHVVGLQVGWLEESTAIPALLWIVSC